jgi:muramoyltetrapeptide carboxypeptidase
MAMNSIIPERLSPGAEVAIVAVSKKIDFKNIEPAIEILEDWGLKVRLAQNIYSTLHNAFAGTDQERLEGLQEMINNKNIKAIFCSRGGYGVTRIIDQIDFNPLIEYPKWIIGFSDISVLLNQAAQNNVASIHGLMAFQFQDKKYKASLDSLKKALFEETCSIPVQPHRLDVQGLAKAPVVGGNLTMITNVLGTPSDFDTSGKILLIEEIEEYLYKIDRMMVHLKRAGKLKNLAGVIIGHMTDMMDNDIPFGREVYEIIHEHVGRLNIPVCFGFPSGHEPDHLAVQFGREAYFEVSERGTLLRFGEFGGNS